MNIAARKTCYRGWKLEYNGYLMAGHYGHNAGTKYTCMDSQPDTLQGQDVFLGGSYVWFFKMSSVCSWERTRLCCLFKRITIEINVNWLNTRCNFNFMCLEHVRHV